MRALDCRLCTLVDSIKHYKMSRLSIKKKYKTKFSLVILSMVIKVRLLEWSTSNMKPSLLESFLKLNWELIWLNYTDITGQLE